MSDQSANPFAMTEAFTILDARGLRCPLPVIAMEAALRRLTPGGRLKVIADDPVAAIDIPHFCREAGHFVERLCDENAFPEAAIAILPETGENPEIPAPGTAKSLIPCVFLVTRGEKA